MQHAPPRPLLLGRHLLQLGLPPGPRIGRILAEVYERQLDGELTTVAEATAAARLLVAGDSDRAEAGSIPAPPRTQH